MIRATIVGASGYAGGELLRLLLGHPRVEVAQITSETYAGKYAHFVHPNLRGHTDLQFTPLASIEPCDLLFLALPHGKAMTEIDAWSERAVRIIDLSADFRLRNAADYETWYDCVHPSPDRLNAFVYGLPELHRAALSSAMYASGPGCNAAVSLLALRPLVQAGWVREVIVDVKAIRAGFHS